MYLRNIRPCGFTLYHLFLIFVVLAGVALTGLFINHQTAVGKERKTYQEADQQITRFVDEASKLAPSTKSIERYCSRSSAKFEEGGLGCSIGGEVSYGPLSKKETDDLVSGLDGLREHLPWRFLGENAEGNNSYSSKNYLKSRIYDYQILRCGVHYLEPNHTSSNAPGLAEKELVVEVGCSGPALSEYYPT